LPDVSKCFRRIRSRHRCQRPPCYFAWGCFRYFSWKREPRPDVVGITPAIAAVGRAVVPTRTVRRLTSAEPTSGDLDRLVVWSLFMIAIRFVERVWPADTHTGMVCSMRPFATSLPSTLSVAVPSFIRRHVALPSSLPGQRTFGGRISLFTAFGGTAQAG